MKPGKSDPAGCRRGRVPLEERLAAKNAASVREHAEATARLNRRYGQGR